MNFYLIGADYKTAPIDVREAIYSRRVEIAGFWEGHSGLETSVLATCNRFEIYGIAENAGDAGRYAESFTRAFRQFSDHGYIKYGKEEVFRHLLRLVSGVESQIKGESQILWQLASWRDKKNFPAPIAELLNDAIALGRGIRAEAGLNDAGNNIATLIYKDVALILGAKSPKIAIAGTGKIAGLFAAHGPEGIKMYFAAHKNYKRAQELAAQAEGEAVSLKELPGILQEADVFISATSSPHTIFDAGYFSGITAARKNRLYAYDLATPRDISPAAKKLPGIILKNIDDITDIFARHNTGLRSNIELAEYMAEETIADYNGESSGKATEDRHKAQPVSA